MTNLLGLKWFRFCCYFFFTWFINLIIGDCLG